MRLLSRQLKIYATKVLAIALFLTNVFAFLPLTAKASFVEHDNRAISVPGNYLWQTLEVGDLGGMANSRYFAGYEFLPLNDGYITELCGYFQGTRPVNLYDGAYRLMASVAVTSGSQWNCGIIDAVKISKGSEYYVVSESAGGDLLYRASVENFLPLKNLDAVIENGVIQDVDKPFGQGLEHFADRIFGLVDVKITSGSNFEKSNANASASLAVMAGETKAVGAIGQKTAVNQAGIKNCASGKCIVCDDEACMIVDDEESKSQMGATFTQICLQGTCYSCTNGKCAKTGAIGAVKNGRYLKNCSENKCVNCLNGSCMITGGDLPKYQYTDYFQIGGGGFGWSDGWSSGIFNNIGLGIGGGPGGIGGGGGFSIADFQAYVKGLIDKYFSENGTGIPQAKFEADVRAYLEKYFTSAEVDSMNLTYSNTNPEAMIKQVSDIALIYSGLTGWGANQTGTPVDEFQLPTQPGCGSSYCQGQTISNIPIVVRDEAGIDHIVGTTSYRLTAADAANLNQGGTFYYPVYAAEQVSLNSGSGANFTPGAKTTASVGAYDQGAATIMTSTDKQGNVTYIYSHDGTTDYFVDSPATQFQGPERVISPIIGNTGSGSTQTGTTASGSTPAVSQSTGDPMADTFAALDSLLAVDTATKAATSNVGTGVSTVTTLATDLNYLVTLNLLDQVIKENATKSVQSNAIQTDWGSMVTNVNKNLNTLANQTSGKTVAEPTVNIDQMQKNLDTLTKTVTQNTVTTANTADNTATTQTKPTTTTTTNTATQQPPTNFGGTELWNTQFKDESSYMSYMLSQPGYSWDGEKFLYNGVYNQQAIDAQDKLRIVRGDTVVTADPNTAACDSLWVDGQQVGGWLGFNEGGGSIGGGVGGGAESGGGTGTEEPVETKVKIPDIGGTIASPQKVIEPTLAITTENRQSTCQYKEGSSFEYGSGTQFDTTGSYEHNTKLGPLTNKEYDYYVVCKDNETGGTSKASKFHFKVDLSQNSEYAPTITNNTTNPQLTASSTLEIATNRKALCQYKKGNTFNYGDAGAIQFKDDGDLVHKAPINAFGDGKHDFYVACKDASYGAAKTLEQSISVTLNPSRVDIAITNKTSVYQVNSVPVLTVETDHGATCQYKEGYSFSYNAGTQFSVDGATSHVSQLSGLSDGQHNFYVVCKENTTGTLTEPYIVTFISYNNANADSCAALSSNDLKNDNQRSNANTSSNNSVYLWQSVETGTRDKFDKVDWFAGYQFTAQKDGKATQLCGYFDSGNTNRVSIYSSSYEEIAGVEISGNSGWKCVDISPVPITSDKRYYVVARVKEAPIYYEYKSGMLPKDAHNAVIEAGIRQADSNNIIKYDYMIFGLVDVRISYETTNTAGPVISSVGPTGSINNSTLLLSAKTDQDSNCRFDRNDVNYAEMKYTLTKAGESSFSQKICGLENGAYTFYVRCKYSGNGQENNSSTQIKFNITGQLSYDQASKRVVARGADLFIGNAGANARCSLSDLALRRLALKTPETRTAVFGGVGGATSVSVAQNGREMTLIADIPDQTGVKNVGAYLRDADGRYVSMISMDNLNGGSGWQYRLDASQLKEGDYSIDVITGNNSGDFSFTEKAAGTVLGAITQNKGNTCKDLKTGGSGRKIDVVFVPCGYGSDMAGFERDAALQIAQFSKFAPISGNLDKFSFKAVEIDGLDCSADLKDNMEKDADRFLQLARSCSPDTVVVLKRESLGGTGISLNGAGINFVSAESPYSTIHEIGHSFFGLSDEYSYGCTFTDMAESPNCTNDPSCSKWKDIEGAGCFSGCTCEGNYRSSNDSVMLDAANATGFSPASSSHILKILKNYE